MNRILRKDLADQSSQVPVLPLPPGSTMPPTLRGGLLWCAVGIVLALALLAPWLLVGQAQAGAQAASHETAAPGPWNGVNDLAFVSATEGWAVGYAEPCATNQASSCTPLLWHYLHSQWLSVSLPFAGWLNTLSMRSPTDGWAGGYDGLLLHYDGHTWQRVANTQDATFLQLQMFSERDGWAIGSLPGAPTTEVLHYDGQTWTQEEPLATLSPFRHSILAAQALAMVSPTEGWVVGTLISSAQSDTLPPLPRGKDGAVILHYVAGHWSLAVQIPDGMLAAISMASATEGWAMGNTEGTHPATPTPAVQQTPLLLHYAGGRWKQVANPVANPVVCCLSTITMRSASDGWAAGPESGLEPRPLATILHYTGGRWTAVRVPVRSGMEATITRIMMLSATEGWAVGSLRRFGSDAPDDTTPLLLHYQHGGWTLSGVPAWRTA